ncbi:hypothetical protein FJZ31_06470 [Candidatus Poribacteria bacterium]|nr:hypothetical protein [Candidatus Poribacteria bacterium]
MIEQNDNDTTINYFGSWGSYRVPFVPQNPISREEAEQRKNYYIAYYNSERQLICFEKFANGKLEWKDEYVYWNNGKLKMRRMTKADKSVIIQQFDHRGRIVL